MIKSIQWPLASVKLNNIEIWNYNKYLAHITTYMPNTNNCYRLNIDLHYFFPQICTSAYQVQHELIQSSKSIYVFHWQLFFMFVEHEHFVFAILNANKPQCAADTCIIDHIFVNPGAWMSTLAIRVLHTQFSLSHS